MKTTNNFENETNKIAINLLVKERASYNGYLTGVKLAKPHGVRQETAITNMIVDGDFVYIYTDTYRVKKSIKNIQKQIVITY